VFTEDAIRQRFGVVATTLNERSRRLLAAAEAKSFGYGGIAAAARATGLARNTIARGLRDIESQTPVPENRVRKSGGGRKRTVLLDPRLAPDLDRLIEPATRGDPSSALRWSCLSTRTLARELMKLGHKTSPRMVAQLLHEMEYSLQANRKTREGARHPDRNAQFHYISRQVKAQQAVGAPVISVDTKKKELVGDFKNGGRQWRPKGQPQEVRVHDFALPGLNKAVPYGVYDLSRNAGWVSVGVDHDTAEFAVQTIRRWWTKMGRPVYRGVESLLITADCGGSNGARVRLWKWELQRLANETGLTIRVCHFPPGTSKWNAIEHRLFSFISHNWRGEPLLSHATIVSLIAATRTTTGLRVRCALDTNQYPSGIEISDAQIEGISIRGARFHGEWNYTIRPQ
jgi:hypothetical protein